MICKGTTHNNGARLAAYMVTGKEGERAELWQLRGFGAANIKDAFRDVQIMAGATKCEQPFFHVQVRNREGETLTRQQWEQAADRIEGMLGLSGQPRAIAFHRDERTGHEHMHVAWSRIDENTLKAKPLPFFKKRLKQISRELEAEFGLEPVTNQREGHIKFAPTRAEQEQARRLGLDIHEVRNAIRECWDRSDRGESFRAALESEGMTLAQGERRDFVVIDRAGGMHVLGKRILDVSAAKIRARLSDVPRTELPTVEEARALIPGTEKTRQPERQQTHMWYDELKGKSREIAGILLTYWNDPSMLPSPKKTFSAALEWRGIALAKVTKEEADRSHREADFAKAIGNHAPRFKEGEIVAVTEPRLEYRRTGEIAAPRRVHKLDQEAAGEFVAALGKRTVLKGIDATLSLLDERAQHRATRFQENRLKRATTINHRAPRIAGVTARTALSAIGSASRVLGKAADFAADAFASLFAPELTPAQKREAEITAARKREEQTIDLSRYTTEFPHKLEPERAHARERERERDR